ncbi:MAG: hypothetical protein ABIY71_03440 [Flavobacteriales bacterium]
MKTALLLRVSPLFSAVLCAGLVHAQNPLPNPGFETWSGGDPVGWNTNNEVVTGDPLTQNGEGHGGSSAARGTYLGLYSWPILNTVDAANQPLPVTQTYERFTFYYKLQLTSAQGTEIFTAVAAFTDAGGNVVGQAFRLFERTENTGTWTYASNPIYNAGPVPTGVKVDFSLTGPDAVVGSYFVVDDVALENGTAGVEELEQGAVWSAAYPVPANHEVNMPFALGQATPVEIAVLDALGRTVRTLDLGMMAPGRYKEVLDVQGWSAGTYTAVLRTASGVRSQLVVVGH